jgi:hypothetical protein
MAANKLVVFSFRSSFILYQVSSQMFNIVLSGLNRVQ